MISFGYNPPLQSPWEDRYNPWDCWNTNIYLISILVSFLSRRMPPSQWSLGIVSLGPPGVMASKYRSHNPYIASVECQPCDVTKSLHSEKHNRQVLLEHLQNLDLLMFFYVCNETSRATKEGNFQFFRDLSEVLQDGVVVLIVDVKSWSSEHLKMVASALSGQRKVTYLSPSKSSIYNSAEVVAFRYDNSRSWYSSSWWNRAEEQKSNHRARKIAVWFWSCNLVYSLLYR